MIQHFIYLDILLVVSGRRYIYRAHQILHPLIAFLLRLTRIDLSVHRADLSVRRVVVTKGVVKEDMCLPLVVVRVSDAPVPGASTARCIIEL